MRTRLHISLVDALGDMLVSKGIISQGDFDAVFETAAVVLAEAPSHASARGSPDGWRRDGCGLREGISSQKMQPAFVLG
jgi:hypothetical protein